MELRALTSQEERNSFTERLCSARRGKGMGFCEAPGSRTGEIHLAFGQCFGLYDEDGPDPGEMLGGFVMHNLSMFGQSYPKPDLTHLPPKDVYECGELWALAPGAARLVRYAGSMLAGVRGAKAVLVYAICRPWNLTLGYQGFVKVGDPVAWPYVITCDGHPIWVQPMVQEGVALQMSVQATTSVGFRAYDGQRLLFQNPYGASPRMRDRLRDRSIPSRRIIQEPVIEMSSPV